MGSLVLGLLRGLVGKVGCRYVDVGLFVGRLFRGLRKCIFTNGCVVDVGSGVDVVDRPRGSMLEGLAVRVVS